MAVTCRKSHFNRQRLLSPIAIVGALREEIGPLLRDVRESSQERVGLTDYYIGSLQNKCVIIAASGWGKVACASTITTLLMHFHTRAVIFFGVAGAVAPRLNIGDVVVGTEVVQHDMDASPIFPKYVIPGLRKSRLHLDSKLCDAAVCVATDFLDALLRSELANDTLSTFGINKPAVYRGLIASGDKFIADKRMLTRLRMALPGLQCVEMEGAAAAQVCSMFDVPLVLVRVISDKADVNAKTDFPSFISKIAGSYSRGIVRGLLMRM